MERAKPVWMVVGLLALVRPLWAGSNNGFESNYGYLIKDDGLVRLINETDGTTITGQDTWLPSGSAQSLTFADTGVNDARLFVALVVPGGNDVQIKEYNSSAGLLNSANLSAIVGGPVTASGRILTLGSIRYGSLSNTLFVSLLPDVDNTTDPNNPTSGSPTRVYEINLGLTHRYHTYVGPPEPRDRNPTISLNARNGTLYMTSRSLGESTTTGLGDLVAFSTAGRPDGGTTTTYTTLVNGSTVHATDGRWTYPHAVIYRKLAGSGSDDTLVVSMAPTSGANPALELWLDTAAHPVDGNGNLAVRGSPISVARGWNGYQDPITGDVWIANLRGGFSVIRTDDSTGGPFDGTRWFQDIASPPFKPCNSPSMDIDGDNDVDQEDFGVLQLCYASPEPLSNTCSCFDRGDDDNNGQPNQNGVVNQFDVTAFVACVSGPTVPANPACGALP